MTQPSASFSRLLALAATLASAVAGAAPLSNPVLGPTPAPLTLEYFTALGCHACEQFEREVLPGLLAEADAGHLRVIVRELPAPDPSLTHRALALLCLSPGPGYLERRAEIQRPTAIPSPTASTGCRHDNAAQGVLDFNAAVFHAQGFHGTPAFVLTSRRAGTPPAHRSWAGRTSWTQWQAALAHLQSTSSESAP